MHENSKISILGSSGELFGLNRVYSGIVRFDSGQVGFSKVFRGTLNIEISINTSDIDL